jgi:hypothetical protein
MVGRAVSGEPVPNGRAIARVSDPPFLARTLAVAVYATAMAYLEAAVVLYLQRALAISPATLFPLRDPESLGGLAQIEFGRELATLVMLSAVGWLAGRSGPERLAWSAVAFGLWDIGYYGWLWLFSGWPSSPGSWDLLFLVPVPWVGPVWAPVVVSVALVGFGLTAARRLRAGRSVHLHLAAVGAGLAGGVLVVLSFTWDAGRILAGGTPSTFPWPVFLAGTGLAARGAARAVRAPPGRSERSALGVHRAPRGTSRRSGLPWASRGRHGHRPVERSQRT